MLVYILLVVILAVIIALFGIFIHHQNERAPETVPNNVPADCCGAHAVCERDQLLSQTDEIVYFDDEELDELSGIPAADYTGEDVTKLEDVFYTLREQDVSGWIRSLQLRNIELPLELRDEALLVVSERREKTLENYNNKVNADF